MRDKEKDHVLKTNQITKIKSDQDKPDTQISGINITSKDTPTKTSHLVTPDPTPEPIEMLLPQSPTSDAEMSSTVPLMTVGTLPVTRLLSRPLILSLCYRLSEGCS